MIFGVTIQVADPQKSARFIEAVFQITRSNEMEQPKEVIFGSTLPRFSFAEWRWLAPNDRAPVVIDTMCQDLDTTIERIRRSGGTVVDGPRWHGKNRFVVAESHCGFLVRAVQLLPDRKTFAFTDIPKFL